MSSHSNRCNCLTILITYEEQTQIQTNWNLLSEFLIAGCLQINAQKVSFNEGTVSLKEAFQKIEASSKYKIAYNGTQLDVNKKSSLIKTMWKYWMY